MAIILAAQLWAHAVSPIPYTDADVELLARMITAEARGESPEGRRAVAWVALNRVEVGGWWGYGLQDVLKMPYQFALADWADPPCLEAARDVLSGQAPVDPTGGATHFHAAGYKPTWARRLTKTVQIGDHVFYK